MNAKIEYDKHVRYRCDLNEEYLIKWKKYWVVSESSIYYCVIDERWLWTTWNKEDFEEVKEVKEIERAIDNDGHQQYDLSVTVDKLVDAVNLLNKQ